MTNFDSIKKMFDGADKQSGRMFTQYGSPLSLENEIVELNMRAVWVFHNEIAMLKSDDPVCAFLRHHQYYDGPYADSSLQEKLLKSDRNQELAEQYGRKYTMSIQGNPVPYVKGFNTHHFNAIGMNPVSSPESHERVRKLAAHSSMVRKAVDQGSFRAAFQMIFKDDFESFLNDKDRSGANPPAFT